jgi:hypothetical protein
VPRDPRTVRSMARLLQTALKQRWLLSALGFVVALVIVFGQVEVAPDHPGSASEPDNRIFVPSLPAQASTGERAPLALDSSSICYTLAITGASSDVEKVAKASLLFDGLEVVAVREPGHFKALVPQGSGGTGKACWVLYLADSVKLVVDNVTSANARLSLAGIGFASFGVAGLPADATWEVSISPLGESTSTDLAGETVHALRGHDWESEFGPVTVLMFPVLAAGVASTDTVAKPFPIGCVVEYLVGADRGDELLTESDSSAVPFRTVAVTNPDASAFEVHGGLVAGASLILTADDPRASRCWEVGRDAAMRGHIALWTREMSDGANVKIWQVCVDGRTSLLWSGVKQGKYNVCLSASDVHMPIDIALHGVGKVQDVIYLVRRGVSWQPCVTSWLDKRFYEHLDLVKVCSDSKVLICTSRIPDEVLVVHAGTGAVGRCKLGRWDWGVPVRRYVDASGRLAGYADAVVELNLVLKERKLVVRSWTANMESLVKDGIMADGAVGFTVTVRRVGESSQNAVELELR